MVIFHSFFVCLPEGIFLFSINPNYPTDLGLQLTYEEFTFSGLQSAAESIWSIGASIHPKHVLVIQCYIYTHNNLYDTYGTLPAYEGIFF